MRALGVKLFESFRTIVPWLQYSVEAKLIF